MLTCTDHIVYKYGVEVAYKMDTYIFWKSELTIIPHYSNSSYFRGGNNEIHADNFHLCPDNCLDMLYITKEEALDSLKQRKLFPN